MSNSKNLSSKQLNDEAKKLVNYFFLGISLAPEDFWVNLQPKDKARMTSEELARTDMGRVLLEQDLQLKKDMAKYLHPDNPVGKRYWEKLYSRGSGLGTWVSGLGNTGISNPESRLPAVAGTLNPEFRGLKIRYSKNILVHIKISLDAAGLQPSKELLMLNTGESKGNSYYGKISGSAEGVASSAVKAGNSQYETMMAKQEEKKQENRGKLLEIVTTVPMFLNQLS